MGNGQPVAGVVASAELIAEFGVKSRHFNTFGGNPFSFAVAGAVLDVIADEGLTENAKSTGQ